MPKFLHILCCFLVVTAIKGQEVAGLVAKYSFNKGSTKDEAGNNDAKAYNVYYLEDRFGNPKAACYFKGDLDSYLSLGTSDVLKPKAGTICAWIKVYGITRKGIGVANNPIYFTRSHSGEDCNDGIILGINMNTRKFGAGVIASCDQAAGGFYMEELSLGKWYFTAFTFNYDSVVVYVNGKIVNGISKKFENKYLSGDSVLIGLRSDLTKNKRSFWGSVDDIRLYNRVLSPSEIEKLHDEPNPNQAAVVLKRIFYALCAIAIIVLMILGVRWRIQYLLKKENEQNLLLNKAYEQEIKVLNAQMDPHYIFNFLTTVQEFISSKDNDKAQMYLSKFARLMRKILETNTKQSITLKEELEIIEKYLEIESVRLNNVFNYNITLDPSFQPEEIQIPHFLLQPIVENAIRNRLLPRAGEKLLTISFERIDENTLSCTIEDNGVGTASAQAAKNTGSERPVSITFLQQRLQLFSKIRGGNYSLVISDKFDTNKNVIGTKVTITLPIIQNKESVEVENYRAH